MKIDISGKKVGDMVFTIDFGNAKITKIEEDFLFIKNISYNIFNGKIFNIDAHPSIFNSAEECAEYFAEVANLYTDDSIKHVDDSWEVIYAEEL